MKSLQLFPRQSSCNPSNATTVVIYDCLKHLNSASPAPFLLPISKWKEFLWCHRVVRRVCVSADKLFHVVFEWAFCIWSLFVNVRGLCLHHYTELWKGFRFGWLIDMCTSHVYVHTTCTHTPSSLSSALLSPPLPANKRQARNPKLGKLYYNYYYERDRDKETNRVRESREIRERQRDRQM